VNRKLRAVRNRSVLIKDGAIKKKREFGVPQRLDLRVREGWKRAGMNFRVPAYYYFGCYAFEIWICTLQLACANLPGAMQLGFTLQLTSISLSTGKREGYKFGMRLK
jgi:hypothetical protein